MKIRVLKNKKLFVDEGAALRYKSNGRYVSCGKRHSGNAIMIGYDYDNMYCAEGHDIILEDCNIDESIWEEMTEEELL